MHLSVSSITRKDKSAQVFATTFGYIVEFIPVVSKGCAHQGLSRFIHEIGIPEKLVSDNALEQGATTTTSNSHWRKLISEYKIHHTFIQPHSPRQNRVEIYIGILRRQIRKLTASKGSPKGLWAYCGLHAATINNLTSSSDNACMNKTPFEIVHGYKPDITLSTLHEWYDLLWWYNPAGQCEKLGRYLGYAGRNVGAGDCFLILYHTCKIYVTNGT